MKSQRSSPNADAARGWDLRALVGLSLGLGIWVLGFVVAAQSGAQRGLTAAPQVLKVYDAIFDARFGDVPAALRAACPPAPAEACQVLTAAALWWQIQLDPVSTRFDAEFRDRVERAVSAAEAWTAREPRRAEA